MYREQLSSTDDSIVYTLYSILFWNRVSSAVCPDELISKAGHSLENRQEEDLWGNCG